MKLQTLVLVLALLLCYGCNNKKELENWNKIEMNELLAKVDLGDPIFIKKEITFDSILTIAGIRKIGAQSERIKCKLFFYDDNIRGYFNLSDQDDKNLQIFGKHVGNHFAFKSATKINMEESDGFLILDEKYNGIWSNGNINFQNGTISMKKQNEDYNSLESW